MLLYNLSTLKGNYCTNEIDDMCSTVVVHIYSLMISTTIQQLYSIYALPPIVPTVVAAAVLSKFSVESKLQFLRGIITSA